MMKIHSLQEVKENYNRVHRLKVSDLTAQAYQEYMNLTMSHAVDSRDPGETRDKDHDQLTAEFQAVIEVSCAPIQAQLTHPISN